MKYLIVDVNLGDLGSYDGKLTWEKDEEDDVFGLYSVCLTVKIGFYTIDITDRIKMEQLLNYHDEILKYERGEL